MGKDLLYPLRRLHGRMHDRSLEKKKAEELCEKIKNADEHSAFLVMTPTHGNLGDHAIAKAIICMLNELNITCTEVYTEDLRLLEKHKMLQQMNGHPIFVNGGGNLGTLWYDVERLFREVIQKNNNSPIICFPNTMFYENTEWGKNELEKSIRIYNAHPKLKLCAREKISYDAMKAIYNDVVLIPDMVMSLNECRENAKRNGCLLCLRSDIEKTRTDDEEKAIRNIATELFGENVCDTDMVVDHRISVNDRDKELDAKFEQFRNAKLAITDRLHGMIFCAITGTPCIVINSKSPKVRGCYEWLKDLEYIRFADDISTIKEIYREIPDKEFAYHNEHLNKHFDELKAYIRELTERGL